MDFSGQLVQLLSEPPGSFVYHLVTLFALQVVFALSYARWRRKPEDDMARRMMIAAAALFAGRLILLIAGVIYSNNPAGAAAVLPPLDQAIDTASLALLAWSLLPPFKEHPRAGDILLIALLVLTGVAYLFFAQSWQTQASASVAYHSTQQALIWTLSQIIILALALLYLLIRGRFLGPFPPIIIGTLLASHIIYLWSYPELAAAQTNVAFWVRLGYLIALPLWAVYAYLHATAPLLESELRRQATVEKLAQSYERAAQVIASDQPLRRIFYALEMLRHTYGTDFAAIGLLNEADDKTIEFFSSRVSQNPGELTQWQMDLEQNQTLSAVLRQGRPSELKRDGLGSRQLYDFFAAAGVEPAASLLVQPLSADNKRIGFLVIPLPDNRDEQAEEALRLAPGLGHFLARALLAPRVAPPSTAEAELPVELQPPATAAVPAAIVFDRARVKDLEFQLDQTREALAEAEQKRRQAEANAIAAQKQARYLAAALRTVQTSVEAAGANSVPPANTSEGPLEDSKQDV
ncbi:MAG: hypothetical protein ACK2UK_01305 [Candidatus Promineifilaceae bacterium]